MITINELKEQLSHRYDECQLLDLLEIDSEMIVNTFTDIIEEKMEYLLGELEKLEGAYGETNSD